MLTYDIVVIGGGPAGIAAAISANKKSSVLLIEREPKLGGILKQCIHDGFGVVRFGEKLSGPEYAERFIAQLENTSVDVALFSFVTAIKRTEGGFELSYVCKEGVEYVCCKKIIFATGCRERTGNGILMQGDRCSGVYTAGAAQNLVNNLGVLPGKRVVILGSGDIGLIMARRFTLEGAKVLGVYEAKPTPSGLTRNIHQCLLDFDIPLHLSATVTRVIGKNRLEAVEISQVDEKMRPIAGTQQLVECDTLVLAVGLIPDNGMTKKLGVNLDGGTKGPVVDQNCETMVPGIYSCGNALHVNDLVDYVSENGETAGAAASEGCDEHSYVQVFHERKFLYVVPQMFNAKSANKKCIFYFRASKELQNQKLTVKAGEKVVLTKSYSKLLPPEMERIAVDFSDIGPFDSLQMILEDK